MYEIANALDPNSEWASERAEKAVNAIIKESRRLERIEMLEEARGIVEKEQDEFPDSQINYEETNYQAGGSHACSNILSALQALEEGGKE